MKWPHLKTSSTFYTSQLLFTQTLYCRRQRTTPWHMSYIDHSGPTRLQRHALPSALLGVQPWRGFFWSREEHTKAIRSTVLTVDHRKILTQTLTDETSYAKLRNVENYEFPSQLQGKAKDIKCLITLSLYAHICRRSKWCRRFSLSHKTFKFFSCSCVSTFTSENGVTIFSNRDGGIWWRKTLSSRCMMETLCLLLQHTGNN